MVEVMWVKGSGGDLGTMQRSGLAALYVERLRSLKNVYRGLAHEDEMVELFNHCIYDLASKAPSIDTPLHGFLPFKHIDHLHPDAAIAIAAAKDGQRITEELFGGTVGWVGWQRPGFDLGLQLLACLEENAAKRASRCGALCSVRTACLPGATLPYESYVNTLEVIEICAEYLEQNEGKNRPVFGGAKIETPGKSRHNKQPNSAPILRGFCSTTNQPVNQSTNQSTPHDWPLLRRRPGAAIHQFQRPRPPRPARHVLSRPFFAHQNQPLVLDLQPDEDLTDVAKNQSLLTPPSFEAYRQMYADYYTTCRHPNSPAMRDPNPVVILWPGVGMFTFAKDKQTARVAAEFYTNAINVMRGAEAVPNTRRCPARKRSTSNTGCWKRRNYSACPGPNPLTGRVALVTGSAGGIGKAIARKFAEEGACVVLNDLNAERLAEAKAEFLKSLRQRRRGDYAAKCNG